MIVAFDTLQNTIQSIFEAVGVSEKDAHTTAEALTRTEAKGVYSHGVHLTQNYIEGIQAGVVSPTAHMKIMREAPAAAVIDGNCGLGATIMREAVELGMQKAKQYGSATITGTHLNHYGAGLVYADMAIQNDMIAILYANANRSLAPFGAKKPYFGTNPYTIGLPSGKMPPFLLDMASSVGAANKLMIMAHNGQQAPEGWGIDADGNPCTDPMTILRKGSLLPFGGIKGSGIAAMVGLMSAMLSEAAYGDDVCCVATKEGDVLNYGFTLQLIDVSSMSDVDVFKARVDDYLKGMIELPPAKEGDRVLYPGYLEQQRLEKAMTDGVSILDSTYNEVATAAKLAGVDISALTA